MQFPELQYPVQFKTVNLNNGISLAYSDEGEGREVILFVHGLASYLPAFLKNTSELKHKFRCIAIDLPGYGKSSSGVFNGRISFYSEVVSSFIKKLGLKSVILGGHSMGGQICITTALMYPHLVKKLILLASAGIEEFSEDQVKEIKRINTVEAFAKSDEAKIRLSFYSNFSNPPGDIEFMIQDRLQMRNWPNFYNYCQVVVNSVKGLLDEPVNHRLLSLTQDALVVYGRNDRFIPNPYIQKKLTVEEIGNIAKEKIRNSEVILIDNCGHFLQWEKPGIINSLIEQFV